MPLHTLIIGHSICKWLEHYLLTKKDRRLSADFNIKEMTTVAWHGIGGRTLIQLIKHDIRIAQKISHYVPRMTNSHILSVLSVVLY
jgi:hypothetical protein